MDEYCGLPKEHDQSYHHFMWSNFFSQIDIKCVRAARTFAAVRSSSGCAADRADDVHAHCCPCRPENANILDGNAAELQVEVRQHAPCRASAAR